MTLYIVTEEIHRHNILVQDNVVIANVQGYLAPLSEAEAMIHIKPYGLLWSQHVQAVKY